MSRIVIVAFAGLLVAGLFLACGEKQNPMGDFQTADASADVSYMAIIAPMMAASCAIQYCHRGNDPLAGIGLDTYDKVQANAVLSNFAIQNGAMPIDPGLPLTDADKKNFQDWVNAGAPNN